MYKRKEICMNGKNRKIEKIEKKINRKHRNKKEIFLKIGKEKRKRKQERNEK
jgi:hypothetical protein